MFNLTLVRLIASVSPIFVSFSIPGLPSAEEVIRDTVEEAIEDVTGGERNQNRGSNQQSTQDGLDPETSELVEVMKVQMNDLYGSGARKDTSAAKPMTGLQLKEYMESQGHLTMNQAEPYWAGKAVDVASQNSFGDAIRNAGLSDAKTATAFKLYALQPNGEPLTSPDQEVGTIRIEGFQYDLAGENRTQLEENFKELDKVLSWYVQQRYGVSGLETLRDSMINTARSEGPKRAAIVESLCSAKAYLCTSDKEVGRAISSYPRSYTLDVPSVGKVFLHIEYRESETVGFEEVPEMMRLRRIEL